MTEYFVGNHPSYKTGNDSNDGLTIDTAFSTWAKVATVWQDGDTIRPIAGSMWREEQNTYPAFIDDLTIEYAGDIETYRLPCMRGDEVIVGAWDNSTDRGDGNTEVYSKSGRDYFFSTGSNGIPPHFYEDDKLLEPMSSLAACQAQPGSSYHTGDLNTITGLTIYIHPYGSTDPNSDGKVYTDTQRDYCLYLGDNPTIRGLKAINSAHDDGTIRGGLNGLWEGVLLQSEFHCTLLESGEMRMAYGFLGSMEFYISNGSGIEVTYDHTICVNNVAHRPPTSRLFSHTTAGEANWYDVINVIDCGVHRCGMTHQSAEEVNVIRPFLSEASSLRGNIAWTVVDPFFRLTTAEPNGQYRSVTSDSLTGFTLNMEGARWYLGASYDMLMYHSASGSTMNLSKSVIYDAATNGFRTGYYGTGVGAQGSISQVVYHGPGTNPARLYRKPNAGAFTSANNVVYPGTTDHPRFWNQTAEYNSLALAQAAGFEVGTIVQDCEFADPENGDFSMSNPPANGAGLERPNITYVDIKLTLDEAEEQVIDYLLSLSIPDGGLTFARTLGRPLGRPLGRML